MNNHDVRIIRLACALTAAELTLEALCRSVARMDDRNGLRVLTALDRYREAMEDLTLPQFDAAHSDLVTAEFQDAVTNLKSRVAGWLEVESSPVERATDPGA